MKRLHFDVILRTRHELASTPGSPWISLAELSRLCECQVQVVRKFIDAGLVEPVKEDAAPVFSTASVIRVRKALRLKRDLNLNFDAVALVMELLDRIEELERKNRRV
ncbi:MAG TPA: chaperone modulator CbpM [Geobacteraceae bacterium]|nr:chaperone modulator CbpM [Geobacteraceae bacterium]